MTEVAITDAPAVIEEYLSRVEQLYADVIRWTMDGSPQATVHRSPVQLSERATGVYTADSLEINRGGDAAPIRLIPRGRFMLGGLGLVDVRSRLGNEDLVYVAEGGPSVGFTFSKGVPIKEVRGRAIYPGIAEGWAWVDESRPTLIHLDRQVFNENVLGSIG